MHGEKHVNGSLLVLRDVLSLSQQQQFRQQVQSRNLGFVQQYPGRVISTTDHAPWILGYFQDAIHEIANHAKISGEVQQAFLCLDLPGSRVMMHRSHADIGAVLTYSLETMVSPRMMVLTNSQESAQDYLGPHEQVILENQCFALEANCALVMINDQTRRHWGYDRDLAPAQVRQAVWIYLAR